MYRLLDLKNGKTLKDPEYTGLDVCTKDNADTCMK
jgi:ribose transport system substrate-binding protein